MEKANIPKIRFDKFNDDWEQRKLLSCIQSITDFRGRTPKKLGMDWSESGYLALSALNVKDGYIDFSQDVHYGNQELYDKWMSGKELHRGQVLFTTEAPMGNVAQVPDNKGYILSQRTIAFDVEEEILSENFLATLLRTPNVFNDLTALSSGGTAKGVSQKSLSGLDVVIPKNIDEQNKLADYFINLDHLITLHQRKYEKLQMIKKSMLEKMFPQNGEKKPEIRFEGFTDDWEQRKLGEYVSITSGEAPSKFEVGTELYVKVDDLNYNDKYVVDTQNKVAEHSTVKRVTKGSVVFPKRGAAIMTNKVRIMGIDSYMDTNMMALTSEKLDSEFLYNIISKEGLYKIADTSTIPQINNKHVEPYEVTIPSFDEQAKIGEYFSNLDNLITLHQRKLEKLRNIKKSMLEKMFV